MWLLKSIATGALFAYIAFYLYQIPFLVRAHRRHAAIGASYWYSMTVQYWAFWLVMGAAFVLGTYLMMKLTYPPLYR